MSRAAFYLSGPLILAIALAIRFGLQTEGNVTGWTVSGALLIVLVTFPTACVLDVIYRREPLQPRLRWWLVRGASLCVWLFAVAVSFLLMQWTAGLTPAPRWKQGPDTEDARAALVKWVGGARASAFRDVYYLEEPTFTGGPRRFLRFDYPDRSELPGVFGGSYAWEAVSPRECERDGSPDWWLRSSAGISYASRDSARALRLCLNEVRHRAYLLGVGH